MRPVLVVLTAVAALALAGPAAAGPLSSITGFAPATHTAECDLTGPGEASSLEFFVAGTVETNSLLSPYRGRPFTLSGTARTSSAGPVASLAATLTIDGLDGAVTAQLAFPGGTSTTGQCRPWLDVVRFSVSGAPYEATRPDGSRERGTYSLVHNRSSSGLSFALVFQFEELLPPPPPPVEQPVTLHLPADMTVEATGPDGAVVPFDAHATQGDRVFAAACSPRSSSTFAFGATTVHCTAGDQSGSFTVTVADTTPPVLVLPELLNPQPFGGQLRFGTIGFVLAYPTSAVDAVDGEVEVTCDPARGAELPPGTTRATCWAEDSRGNRAEGTFLIALPSLVQSWDILVGTLLRGTLVEWLFGAQLDQIRSLLVLIDEQKAGAAALRQATKTLANLIQLVSRNPLTQTVAGGLSAYGLQQQSMLNMNLRIGAVQGLGSMSTLLAAGCPECSGASSSISAIEVAIRTGAVDVAVQELARFEWIVRRLRATGTINPLLADALLTAARVVDGYLRALQATHP